MKILDIPLVRPIAIIVIFGLAAVFGINQYQNMKYELMPSMSMPIVVVLTTYPGASPNEVEDLVSRKVEDAVSSVSRIKEVTSSSYENMSMVMIEFLADTNVDLALQEVQRKINAIANDLPDDAYTPGLYKFSMDDLPIMSLAATSKFEPGPFYQLMKDKIQPQLNQIPGVGQITLLGGNAREIRVNVSQAKLEQYGIPILLVSQKIKAANLDFPAGNIKDKDGQYVVRIAGKLKNLDEMRNLVIKDMGKGRTVKLSDIADVEDALADSASILRYNGNNTIGLLIVKQSGANAVSVSKAIHAELDLLEREYADQGLKFAVAQDTSIFTLESANDVVRDIAIAIVLVGVIMLLFLHDIKNAFIVMMAIPATLLTTFIGMGFGNFTLNLMSLLALSLVIGILVDDSIVVIENIHRHRTLGKGIVEAARVGVREIAFAATAVTLVIVVAFLPVSLIGGTIGGMLIQFGLTLVIATAISLFVSFTLTPMLAVKIIGGEDSKAAGFMHRFGEAFDRAFNVVVVFFQWVLDWTINHKKVTVALSVLVLVMSFGLVATGAVGSEFMTPIDRGEFNVNLELPERVTLEQNEEIVRGIEKMLNDRPEVETVYAKIGFDSSNSSTNNYKSQVAVKLVPRDQRSKSSIAIGNEVNDAVKKIPGVKVKVSQIGLVDMTSDDIQYNVTGTNYADNYKVAEEWVRVMKEVQGTGEVRMSVSNGKPELQIDIDRAKLSDLGLSLDAVGASLRNALSGNTDLTYTEGGSEYDINIMLDSVDRTSTAQIRDMSFTNNQGQQIRLSQFADIHNSFGPTVLKRVNRIGTISVTAQAIGRPAGDINKEILAKAASIKLPEGVDVSPSGRLKMQSESFGSLGTALWFSVILIYAILAILFNSLIYPIAVMFCLPFAVVGGFVSLAITGQTLNIFSIMSIILLIGLSAKNAILLVDRAIKNHEDGGMDYRDAFKEAVTTRIRPIVMTTAAMVFGMIPVAMGLGSAGEMKTAMGVVLIGGLIFGMVVTMIIVPVTFLSFEKIRNRFVQPKLQLEDN
jgi:hydrophobe/amphiphile efflux-1 (HAE1) family protein